MSSSFSKDRFASLSVNIDRVEVVCGRQWFNTGDQPDVQVCFLGRDTCLAVQEPAQCVFDIS